MKFEITAENVLDVLQVLVNYEEKISCIKQTNIEGSEYPGYEVHFEYLLPHDLISTSPGFWNKVTFVGVGEDIVEAVQDVINRMQIWFEDDRFKTELSDYKIEFEMNIASALGLLKKSTKKFIDLANK